ncbi:MAG: HyaD/HybD family hydrogenase maturation endopeptidase [Acidobacteriota bacterium]|jgi:hydrogenase maturation protease|nr:HyaD/HybD family hydrogenase maturation endopeptidase [Acidobacteriota bacterium]
MNVLVLGVGNYLLKDEGIGIHAIRALEAEELPKGVALLDGGTGGLYLLHWLQGYERIVMIDATLDEYPPGTVRRIRPRYAADFPPALSAHEIGLRDMIAAMTLVGGALPDIRLIVVSVADFQEIGTELSPMVARAIPEVVRTVREEIC